MYSMFSHQFIKLCLFATVQDEVKTITARNHYKSALLSVSALSMFIFFCLPCMLFVTDSVFDSRKILDLKDSSSFEGQTLMMLPPT